MLWHIGDYGSVLSRDIAVEDTVMTRWYITRQRVIFVNVRLNDRRRIRYAVLAALLTSAAIASVVGSVPGAVACICARLILASASSEDGLKADATDGMGGLCCSPECCIGAGCCSCRLFSITTRASTGYAFWRSSMILLASPIVAAVRCWMIVRASMGAW